MNGLNIGALAIIINRDQAKNRLCLVCKNVKISATFYSTFQGNKQRKWTSYKRCVVNFHHCFPNCQDFIAVKIVSFLPLYPGFHTEGVHFSVGTSGGSGQEGSDFSAFKSNFDTTIVGTKPECGI